MLCYVQNYPGTSLLEQSLFRKFVGPLSVIAVIASFLSFSRNVDLQLASANMLTSLCISAQKARPHPISIASYVTFPEQRKVLCTAVSQLLSEEYWLFNNAVFCAVIDLITAAVKFQVPMLPDSCSSQTHAMLLLSYKPIGALASSLNNLEISMYIILSPTDGNFLELYFVNIFTASL
jgi:hypothetical protein